MTAKSRPGYLPSLGFSALQVGFIVACGIVGLLGGIFLSGQGSDEVTATTPILVNPLDGNPFRPSNRGEQLVNLETEAQAVRSTTVAESVIATTGADVPAEELIDSVSVAVPVNTQILEISYTDLDADEALAMSQAFAEAYLTVRSSRAQDLIADQVTQIDEQTASLNERLLSATQNLGDTDTDTAEASLLEQEIDGLADQINTLESRKNELSGTPVDPGQVVTNAELEGSGPLSNPLVLPLAGLLGGLGFGFVLVLVKSQADDRVNEPLDIAATGLEVVGTIGWWDGDGPAAADRSARLRDEVRRLCVTVLSMEKRRPLTLLVAPGGEDRHYARFATEVSMAFARGGFRTLVLDTTGDLRLEDPDRNGSSPASDEPLHVGLSDVIMGESPLSDAKQHASGRLELIGPGPDMAAASDLFLGEPMGRLINDARAQCDVLLVTGDSATGSTAQALASAVDAALIEVEAGTLTKRELEALRRSVELLDTSLLGAVFVGDGGSDLAAELESEVHRRSLMPGPLELFRATGSGDEPEGDDPTVAQQVDRESAPDTVDPDAEPTTTTP